MSKLFDNYLHISTRAPVEQTPKMINAYLVRIKRAYDRMHAVLEQMKDNDADSL